MNISEFLTARRASGFARSAIATKVSNWTKHRWRVTIGTNTIKHDLIDFAGTSPNTSIMDGVTSTYRLEGSALFKDVEGLHENLQFVAQGKVGFFPNVQGSLVGFLGWLKPPTITSDDVRELIDEAERTGYMDAQKAMVERLALP